jgi:hypothetical protein
VKGGGDLVNVERLLSEGKDPLHQLSKGGGLGIRWWEATVDVENTGHCEGHCIHVAAYQHPCLELPCNSSGCNECQAYCLLGEGEVA